jgi:CBS domain-containing membrane protein
MTETVVVIEVDRPLSEALDCFRQYGIHHLPILRQGRLAGMLSSADVLKLEHFAPPGTDARFLDERLTLEQVMRTPVVSVRPTTSLGEAAETLMASGVHALPVVDDDGHVIGIVSSSDMIRSLLHGPPRRLEAGVQTPPQKLEDTSTEHVVRLKPSDEEFAMALAAAETAYVSDRDPRHLGKAFLYLTQRRAYLERMLTLADRFLRAGQDEHHHALLLKAILAAKRAEELATQQPRVPFPLD